MTSKRFCRTAYLLSMILLLAIIVFIYSSFNRDLQNKMIEVEQANNKVQAYKTRIDEQGRMIATQKQKIISLSDAIDQNLLEYEKTIRQIEAQAKIRLNTHIKGLELNYIDSVQVVYDTLFRVQYIKVPMRAIYIDSFTYIHGTVHADSFVIDSLKLINPIRFTLAKQKDKWYKRAYPVVEVKSGNPNSEVVLESNYVIRRNWWQRWFSRK